MKRTKQMLFISKEETVIWYNLYMRKCNFILPVLLLLSALVLHAENAAPVVGRASFTVSEGAAENIQAVKEGEGFVSGTVTKSSLVTRMDFQLNDKILHTSVSFII